MQKGYVKVWRKIEDSGLIQLPNTLALFMHLLLKASHKDTKRGTSSGVVELKRGQFISGIHKLSEALEQTEREVRTSIKRLIDLGIISVQATNKFSIYTIENYNKYQDSDIANDKQNDKETTGNRQTNDKETTTKQEFKNLKNLNIEGGDGEITPENKQNIIQLEIASAPPPTEFVYSSQKFSMYADWEPSANFETLAKIAGMPLGDEYPVDEFLEFRSYWVTQPKRQRTQGEWEHAFITNCKIKKSRQTG